VYRRSGATAGPGGTACRNSMTGDVDIGLLSDGGRGAGV
jgi:hypothetical protein